MSQPEIIEGADVAVNWPPGPPRPGRIIEVCKDEVNVRVAFSDFPDASPMKVKIADLLTIPEDLIEAIIAKRNDPEFMGRLHARIAQDMPMLTLLADGGEIVPTPTPTPTKGYPISELPSIPAGVYEHTRHPSDYYLILGLARIHDTDDEYVAYVPLRVEPEWSGSARIALRKLSDFITTFRPVGLRLP